MGLEVLSICPFHCLCITIPLILNRGHEAVDNQPAVRNPRYSVMAAINVNGLVAYNILEGSMNGEKLYWWAVLRLLPKCSAYPGPNSLIILDNVRFHKNKLFKTICGYVGVKLLYLPPYSPHLNVIEWLFNALKANLRQYPLFCDTEIRNIARLIMEYRIKSIKWKSVCMKIGYQHHVSGLN